MTMTGSGMRPVGAHHRADVIATCAEVIFLLVKKPRTISELAELTGHKFEILSKYLKAFEAEGLMSFENVGRNRSQVWRWSPLHVTSDP